MTFAKRLKQSMASQGISQVELANRIGKGKSSVSQYLSGKNIPKYDVQERIASVLDCTIDWLNGEGEDETYIDQYNVSIADAAKKLNKSPQFVRISLQMGTAPFGFATRTSTRWSYHISYKKLNEYIGL
jgi:transcriptional regulator with XRE-family HTH domain